MDAVIKSYENYDEEGRLVRDKAHQIEFITTVSFLDKLIAPKSKIIELGAATGRYSFYFAEKGHSVTALDIVPKHINQMKEKLLSSRTSLSIQIEQGNATDLSGFEDESYDAVLCLGPLYHLISEEDRLKCIRESLRILKKGGILAAAYINRYYVFAEVTMHDKKFLNPSFMKKIIEDGFTKDGDEDCFWTDAYFYTPSEMEKMMSSFNVERIMNIGTDGIGILMRDMINGLNEDEYKNWLEYHFKTCREPSILGYSNHGLYICRKGQNP